MLYETMLNSTSFVLAYEIYTLRLEIIKLTEKQTPLLSSKLDNIHVIKWQNNNFNADIK